MGLSLSVYKTKDKIHYLKKIQSISTIRLSMPTGFPKRIFPFYERHRVAATQWGDTNEPFLHDRWWVTRRKEHPLPPRQKYLPEKQVAAVILPLSRLFSESEHRRSPCSLTAAVLFLRTRESPPFRKSGLLLTFLFVGFIICSIPINVNSFFDKRFEYIGKIYFTFPALTNGAGQDTISVRQRIGFARRKTKEIGKDE